MALNNLPVSIVLPALPAIALTYTNGDVASAQLLIMVYLVGAGLGQLILGPASDVHGRRTVLVFGLILFIVGSLLCALAEGFWLLLAARLLQGIGASSCRVLSAVIPRDLFRSAMLSRILSTALLLTIAVPILAPVLGQGVMVVASWRMVFVALAVVAALILAWVLVRLPETRAEDGGSMAFRSLLDTYRGVLSTHRVVLPVVAAPFVFGYMYAFVSLAQPLLADVYALGPAFTLAFAGLASAVAVGSLVNILIVRRLGLVRTTRAGTVVWLVAVVSQTSIWLAGQLALWPFLLTTALALACFGILSSSLGALALDGTQKNTGVAGALFGCMATGGGGAAGGLFATLYKGDVASFVLTGLCLCVVGSALIWWATAIREKTVPTVT